ncbi:MAG: hypothetical protein P8I61_02155 [Opitutae bacterium]|nr:hypothetical protein [Opitutae bacterium]
MYSWSNEDYVRNTDESGKPLAEICAFLEGNYYPEVTQNEMPVESVSFQTVIQILAPEMMKQNFILDQPPESVDFILLVNWGFTEEVTDDYEFMDQEMVVMDLDDGSQEIQMIDIGSTNSFSTVGSDNAKLIGAMKMSELYPYSFKRRLLLEASEEKRLFVNVTAFEKTHLQNKTLEDKLKPSWITFFSIPFYNIETADAIQAISEMASRHMGYDWDSPSFIDYNDKKFDTTPDALEFISIENDEE